MSFVPKRAYIILTYYLTFVVQLDLSIGHNLPPGSSGGSLVATPDCKPVVPDSNPAIPPAYSGLPILGWAAIWDGTPL
jgi:hypothetical protein